MDGGGKEEKQIPKKKMGLKMISYTHPEKEKGGGSVPKEGVGKKNSGRRSPQEKRGWRGGFFRRRTKGVSSRKRLKKIPLTSRRGGKGRLR